MMSRKMKWAGHVARFGTKINSYRILLRKPDGKRQLGRPRCRYGDVKVNLRLRRGTIGRPL
jgi:hypothetical protein